MLVFLLKGRKQRKIVSTPLLEYRLRKGRDSHMNKYGEKGENGDVAAPGHERVKAFDLRVNAPWPAGDPAL